MRIIPVTVLLLMMTGCRSGPLQPLEIESHDMCSSCRMAISQKQFAAQIFDAEENVFKFDDLDCMLRFLNQREMKPATVFVADYETREWINGASALFVRTDKVATPMGGGLLAFSDRARADQAARSFASSVRLPRQIGLPSK